MGDQSVENYIDSNPAGTAEAFQVTASTSGQVTYINVFVDAASTATQLIIGVYADSHGHPGTLLTQGSMTQPAAGVWNAIAVTPVNVTAGTKYWFAILGTQSGIPSFRDSEVGGCTSQTSSQTTLTTLPATWTTGTTYTTCPLSAYALTAAPSGPSVILGDEAIEGQLDNNPLGQAEAFQATANGSGTVVGINLSLDSSSTAGTVYAGLYADNNGHPGSLIVQGSTTQPIAGAWNQISIAPTSLTVGTNYWIAILGTQSGTISFYDRTEGACNSETSSQTTLASLPSSWRTRFVYTDCPLSAYALTAAPVLVVSPTTISMNATQGGSNPSPVNLSVSNTGGGTFNFTASSDSSWLAVAPTSGISPETLQVSATTGNLTAGTYTGHVTVTAPGVQGSASVTPVTFTVSTSSPTPTITSFTPASASIGALVSVTGTNFTANNATPIVSLSQLGGGTIPASVSSATATSLSFVIPTGAATGPITIMVNGQNAVSSTSLTITAASSFTVSASPSTGTLLPGQSTTYEVTLTSTNSFTQLATLGVSGVPSGVTATFQPPQISTGQFSILTLTAPSGQAPGAAGLTITGSATVQGIAESASANVTLQVQGTSGVAFVGRVAVTDAYDTPLVGVTVRMMGVNQTGVSTGCTGSATTDGAGNFLLNGLSASCAGGQLIQYDPSTVTAPLPATYSGVTLSYSLTSGQVTTPGIIVHLPRVDNAETFSIQQNGSVDQTFVSRSIPGLTITVYAGTTLTLANGTSPNPFPLSVVEIPYDRLPELMPPNPTQDPIFAMSIEPFNSSASQPVAVSFPNRSKIAPGTDMPLTSLNPTMGIMVNYGTAAVSADGTQVVPDLDSAHPGHRYGISHFDWHFPLTPPAGQSKPSLQGLSAGDPVDLASGLPVVTKTDIALGGARGQIGITRVFRGATAIQGPFGIGTNHNYGYRIDTTNLQGGLILLDFPDGNQIPFVQAGTIFVNATLPSAQGAFISNVSCLGGGICSATLRWKNGTTWQFQPLLSGIIGSTTFSFLSAIIDSNGNKTTLVRDPSAGAITQVIDPAGRSLILTYDSPNVFFGHILSITDPIGRKVQYTYNSQSYLATVTDVNGGVTTYGYDANNNLQTITDARGITYLTNVFDTNGRVTQQTTADGAVTKFSYTPANVTIGTSPVLVTIVTDPLGNQTTYHFNPAGFVLDITDALGRKTVYNTDPATNLTLNITDPLGRITAFIYDPFGNVTSVTRLSGTPSQVTTSFTYDPIFNKLTSVTDPLGHFTSFSYDKAGNLTQVTDPIDPPASLGYDGAGELTSATDPVGNTATLAYDGFGNLTQFKDPLSRTLSRVADAVGRTQSVTNPLGQKLQYQYNPLNQVTQVTDPLNGQTSLTYDPNGNLLSLADPLGATHTTSYTYDNMDRVQTRKDPLGNSESYQYDLDGNLTQFTDRRGKVTTLKYDPVNRLMFVGFGTTGGSNYESTISYSYDAGDRLTQAVDSVTGTTTRSYDGLDRLISETTPQGSLSYSYDAAGRRTGMSVSGQSAIGYSYDNANRLTQITQGSANVTIVPDSDGRRQSLTLPNGVKMAYAYDAASQLTGITYTLGSNTLGNLSYAYDLAGRRTNVGGSFARTSVPQATSSASYNVNNQLANWKGATLTYDANGNLTGDGTNTYTWNARNQLVAISGGVTASFQYDPFGRRVSKTIGGTTQYLYDGANPVQEISGTSASANLLTGGVDKYFQRTDSAGARNFLTDALGSTLALADSTGTMQASYTFEPFGTTTVTGSATTNSFAFTGRELDPTGLYFYRGRYYSPSLQRFLSEDPAGFRGGINKYAYVQNSPLNFGDPFGLQAAATGPGIETVSQAEVDAYIAELEASLGIEGAGAGAAGAAAGIGAATVGLVVLDVGLLGYDAYELHKLCVAYGICGPGGNPSPSPNSGPSPGSPPASPLPGRNSHAKGCRGPGGYDPGDNPCYELYTAEVIACYAFINDMPRYLDCLDRAELNYLLCLHGMEPLPPDDCVAQLGERAVVKPDFPEGMADG